jgi:L-aminopeptidase/D-esterase-like protein
VGAGAGATVGTWRGADEARPGGIGSATCRDGEVVVSALVAVNASGDIDDGSASRGDIDLATLRRHPATAYRGTNTTIGVVVTNARLDKNGCLVMAQGGHDGMARAIFPPHTGSDGDALVAAATGAVDGEADLVRALAVVAVERAIRVLGARSDHR